MQKPKLKPLGKFNQKVIASKHQKIGLLGGAFHPAHQGHLYISQEAIKHLGLDAVWWLIAADHPQKPSLAPLTARLSQAKSLLRHTSRIYPTDLEYQLGTSYTVDTIHALKKHFPNTHFIWIMGMDNLATFASWHRWRAIFSQIPLVIFNRGKDYYKALAALPATAYKHSRVCGQNLRLLPTAPPPAWGIVTIRKHPASSSEIRNSLTMTQFQKP